MSSTRRMTIVIHFFTALTIMMPVFSRAAFERVGTGADMCGMSVTGVSQVDPLFIPFINTAAEPAGKGWSFSTFYSRRFNMRELTRVGFAVSSAGGKMLWSLGGEKFGNNLYSEELALIGIGFPVAVRTRVGFAARFHRLRIRGYGDAFAPGFDLSWFSTLTGNLHFGAVWRNINRPGLGLSGTRVPSGLIVGLGGTFTERLVWTVEGNRAMMTGEGIGFGFALDVTGPLKMRMGYRRETGEYSLGSTLHLPLFRWDYAFSLHPVLGASHYISISFRDR